VEDVVQFNKCNSKALRLTAKNMVSFEKYFLTLQLFQVFVCADSLRRTRFVNILASIALHVRTTRLWFLASRPQIHTCKNTSIAAGKYVRVEVVVNKSSCIATVSAN